jgi:hypothetical protein
MTFFDCVYLKVSKFYSKAEKKDLSGFDGLVVLALMQFLNIFTLFLIFCIIFHHKPRFPGWSVVLLEFALMFANGVRYYSISFSSLQEKWDEVPEKRKNIQNILVPVYITGSIILCLILAVYVGDKNY